MRPAGGQHQSTDHFQRGGFARAVWADQAKHFAGRDFHGQAVGSNQLPRPARRKVVLFGDIIESNHVECAIVSASLSASTYFG